MHSEFITRFSAFTQEINRLIGADNIGDAVAVDKKRKTLLQNYMAQLNSPPPKDVLAFIEEAACENAALITDMQANIMTLSRRAGQAHKMMRAYCGK